MVTRKLEHALKGKFLYSAVSSPQDHSKRFTLYFPNTQTQLIQLSELEQCRVKKLSQGFITAAQDSNPDSRSRESEALPLSHWALHALITGMIEGNNLKGRKIIK